jgi:hypothetical protein
MGHKEVVGNPLTCVCERERESERERDTTLNK